jgi:hypothetical protein
VHGEVQSLALVNDAVCGRIAERGHVVVRVGPGHRQTAEEEEAQGREMGAFFQQALGRGADVHVGHQWPPRFTAPAQGHWVVMQHWEFGSWPQAWIEPLTQEVDEVWVASR